VSDIRWPDGEEDKPRPQRFGEWRVMLRPFEGVYGSLVAMVRVHDDASLDRLLAASRMVTDTNCSWQMFEVAKVVERLALDEIISRQRERARRSRNGITAMLVGGPRSGEIFEWQDEPSEIRFAVGPPPATLTDAEPAPDVSPPTALVYRRLGAVHGTDRAVVYQYDHTR